MQSKHAIAYGFPITESELGNALEKHLEGNLNTPWSWESYTPAELIEDEGAISVYQEALEQGVLTPQYGPMAPEIVSLESAEGENILIAASSVQEVMNGDLSSMDLPSQGDDMALENFAEFLGRGELPPFKLHYGILEEGQ